MLLWGCRLGGRWVPSPDCPDQDCAALGVPENRMKKSLTGRRCRFGRLPLGESSAGLGEDERAGGRGRREQNGSSRARYGCQPAAGGGPCLAGSGPGVVARNASGGRGAELPGGRELPLRPGARKLASAPRRLLAGATPAC